MAINSYPDNSGGEVNFPDQLIDPVSKFRVSNPENLIDTDFEYGLQPTKWETVELINNTPSFFSKSGDTTIDGISSIITNSGTREIIVKTELDHGLAVGIPINVTGTKSITADGAYIINSIPDPKTFTYLCKDNQSETNSILDLYSSIITGEFFQGSQLRISDSDGIVTDAEGTSLLTVTTNTTHGFGENTPFYFLNLNSTVAQEFQAANTASKSFDASNSATAQTFDASNSLSSVSIDWSSSGTFGGTVSNITATDPAADKITVSHTSENFSSLSLGTPLYYSVSSASGYFNTNPRGVVFLKTTDELGTSTSTFQVSEVPNGDPINITTTLSGTFQLSNQSRIFAGNNLNPTTQTVIDVEAGSPINFDGGNQGYTGEVQGTPPNNTLTVLSYSGTTINADGASAADYYVGAMVLYSSTGAGATGLNKDATYFVTSVTNNGGGNYDFSVAALPGGTPISITTGTGSGTQTFARIGVSSDKDIVHIPNSAFSEGDMLEYTFPVDGRFNVEDPEEEKIFYFVDVAYDTHNYKLSEDLGFKPIVATGGTILPDVIDKGRTWRIHQFSSVGTTNFVVSDAGKESIVEYLIVAGGGGGGGGRHAGGGGAGGLLEGSTTVTATSYSVVVGDGGNGGVTSGSSSTTAAVNGQNSSAFGLTAIGGGRGGGHPGPTESGANGGSGGGAGHSGTGGTGTAGQGFNGTGILNRASNGGGGGAGGPSVQGFGAESAGTGKGADGGPGKMSRILGTPLWFAGGGGGSGSPEVFSAEWYGGDGGIGGGGGGGVSTSNTTSIGGNNGGSSLNAGQNGIKSTATGTTNGGNGGANTGGGGGGAAGWGGNGNGNGGKGGSGIVIVRYPITPPIDFTPASATGGTVSETIESGIIYKVHTFTTTGTSTFAVTDVGSWDEFDYLIVAGGGAGGSGNSVGYESGGGGAGGFLTGKVKLGTAGNKAIVVGAGGVSSNGQNSSAFGFTAIGGGKGGNGEQAGAAGGSGGGGAHANTAGGAGTPGQGFAGARPNYTSSGGGGGGAQEAGNTDGVGSGGDGRASLINGALTYYAGGGAAFHALGPLGPSVGKPGLGGGGTSSSTLNGGLPNAGPGAANTGGGGGANYHQTGAPGGPGGSGIVIIRYPIQVLTPGEFPIASGGQVTVSTSGGFRYATHSFTEVGSQAFNVESVGSVSGNNAADYLIVGGGGSGGGRHGGGGGGGGYISGTRTLTATTYPITVGDGGAAVEGNGVLGNNGSSSSFGGETANGGGAGGVYGDSGATSKNAIAGGSGGGAGFTSSAASSNQPAGVTGTAYGFAGGAGGPNVVSGGGGGAGGVGGNGSSPTGAGDGGPGRQWIDGLYYAAGGGGGSWNEGRAGNGGIGGGGGGNRSDGGGGSTVGVGGGFARNPGGNGNYVTNNGVITRAGSGGKNTGSGGGGGEQSGYQSYRGTSGAGGSGIVIIRYKIGTA
jgi:hypothetical protein